MSTESANKLMLYLRSILNTGYRPYQLKLRAGNELSAAAAFQTKKCVEIIQTLSDDEINQISTGTYTNSRGRNFEYKPYIDHFLQLAQLNKSKADIKNISTGKDHYSILVQAIKLKIEDFIVEQEQKIDIAIHNQYNHIHNEYKNLTAIEFKEKYGEKKYTRSIYGQEPKAYYELSLFYRSNLGILLQLPIERLPEFIVKAKKAYRDKEYSKIDKLVYKLKSKYPSLINFIMTNYNRGIDGIEFILTTNNDNGNVSIHTTTIYAGGYNIQRLHLRWLMSITDSMGKKVKIEQG